MGSQESGWAYFDTGKCIGLLFTVFFSSAVLVLTTPKSGVGSILRYAWVGVLWVLGKALLEEVYRISTSKTINSLVGGELNIVLLHLFTVVTLRRIDEGDLVRNKVLKPSDGFVQKVVRVVGLFFNLREVHTGWQIKTLNRQHPDLYEKRGGTANPSKGWYVARQLLIIGWQMLLQDFSWASGLDTSAGELEHMFGPGKSTLYFGADATQWGGRIMIGLVSWMTVTRATIDSGYRLMTVGSVLLGRCEPRDWFPLFGRLQDAYTLRRFWNTYWHQWCRQMLTSIGDFICRDILHLPRPSLVERYLKISIAFLVSGALHVIIGLLTLEQWNVTGTMAFFGSFAVGIIIEDAAQAIYRSITGTKKEDVQLQVWHRLVGYAWVASWFVATTSWYMNAFALLPPHLTWMVPFSVVQRIGVPTAAGVVLVGGLVLKVTLRGRI